MKAKALAVADENNEIPLHIIRMAKILGWQHQMLAWMWYEISCAFMIRMWNSTNALAKDLSVS